MFDTDETSFESLIADEILVDCYDGLDQLSSWFSYLEAHLSFPFEAEVVAERRISPLKVDQKVYVTGMGAEEDCYVNEIWVDIVWERDGVLSVPLMQLLPFETDTETEQAVAAWVYWRK